MSVGIGALLLVLVVLVAVAGASFFQHPLTVLLVVLALPPVVVLREVGGSGLMAFAIGLLAVVMVLIHTINDTLRQVRAARRVRRRTAQPHARHQAPRRSSERSRAA